MGLLFKIENLKHSYDNNGIVINISQLEIQRGKIIMFLGNSGCGKTTFLEVLGLMNKPTYDEYTSIKFYSENESEKIFDYKELWQNSNLISDVRNKYFSFMFQQPDMLPQFFVDENICLTRMIQGELLNSAKADAHKKMEAIGIASKIGNIYPQKLSGGQQQRAAFARAITPEYTVLFGDELTGNLGDEDSRNVFKIIQEHIQKSEGKHSALVVTHNIDLALEFADQIIIIPENGLKIEGKKGIDIFESIDLDKKKIWKEFGDNKKECIRNLMNRGKNYENNYNKKDKTIITGVNFEHLFSKRIGSELSALSKDGAILILILIIAFCSIGFANGGLNYLDEKMRDPFVNWIDIDIPRHKVNDLNDMIQKLNETKTKYFIKETTGYYSYALAIRNTKKKDNYYCFGRTIDIKDPILKKILSRENLIKGKGFNSSNDIGLIISNKFFKAYGQDEDSLFINMSFSQMNDQDRIVPVPIIAVVKDLPGKNLFASTLYFHDQRFVDETNAFNPKKSKYLKIFIKGDEDKGWNLKNELDIFFRNLKDDYENIFIRDPEPYNCSYEKGYVLQTIIEPKPTLKDFDSIFKEFKNFSKFSHIIQLYHHPLGQMQSTKKFDRLSIHLSSLNSVSELKECLRQKPFELEIDMTRIENLKNYNFVTSLTNTISSMLIFISIISVCVFISYILYLHLYKMRVYIGTFKAFGVSDGILRKIYLGVMIKFISITILFSFIFSVTLGFSGFFRYLLSFIYPMETSHLYFNLLNLPFIITVIAIFFSATLILFFTSNYILKHSPGDLIYNRID